MKCGDSFCYFRFETMCDLRGEPVYPGDILTLIVTAGNCHSLLSPMRGRASQTRIY